MTTRHVLSTGGFALALVLTVVVGVGALSSRARERPPVDGGAAVADITITPEAVRPGLLTATVERPVTFGTRAPGPVHLEFLGDDGHHVFEIADRLSAVFHRPGRHAYVVHVGGRALPGAVDVQDDPRHTARLPVCGRVSIEESCIDF